MQIYYYWQQIFFFQFTSFNFIYNYLLTLTQFCLKSMAVTCDKMFKRKITGGLRLPWHKKRAYAAGRPAAMTKVHIVKSTNANDS